MATTVQITFDCSDPDSLAHFWADLLGYQLDTPPDGFDSWEDWLKEQGIPESEWNSKSAITDPDGDGPRIFFQRVPEQKERKNRVHVDVNAGGPLGTPVDERQRLVDAAVERAVGLGATKIRLVEERGERFYRDAGSREQRVLPAVAIARQGSGPSAAPGYAEARWRMAASIVVRSGSHACFETGAYGAGWPRAPTRSIGASRSQNASRATVAAISAPMPNGTTASWAMSRRLVLRTDSSTGPCRAERRSAGRSPRPRSRRRRPPRPPRRVRAPSATPTPA